MASIRLREVTRICSKCFRAVDHVSFEVADREIVTVLGPSGCGKSTLLQIIARVDFPTSGEIEIGGVIMNAVPARERNIAMVFQSYVLYPHMTCFENLAPESPVEETVPLRNREARTRHSPPSGNRRTARKEAARTERRSTPARRCGSRKELFRKLDATVVYVSYKTRWRQ